MADNDTLTAIRAILTDIRNFDCEIRDLLRERLPEPPAPEWHPVPGEDAYQPAPEPRKPTSIVDRRRREALEAAFRDLRVRVDYYDTCSPGNKIEARDGILSGVRKWVAAYIGPQDTPAPSGGGEVACEYHEGLRGPEEACQACHLAGKDREIADLADKLACALIGQEKGRGDIEDRDREIAALRAALAAAPDEEVEP